LTINTNTNLISNFEATSTSVTVISPNRGEILKSGSIYTIRWITNATNTPVAKVRLWYTTNGGNTWDFIGTLPGNPGSYGWKVPNVSSGSCKVKIRLKDASGNPVGKDRSDGYFTIQP
jgi:hypothetical protein